MGNQDQALRTSFRAYDVRGVYPDEINEAMVYRITKAFIGFTQATEIILGRDARTMNPSLFAEAVRAAQEAQVDVIDLGLITTDMLYFASGFLNRPGFSITASHNPPAYSGMKMILAGAQALSADTGFHAIRDRACIEKYHPTSDHLPRGGKVHHRDLLPEYLDHILTFIDRPKIRPLRIVTNTMFGVASNIVTDLVKRLPIEIIPLNFEIDGTYPKGSPNPMLPHLREETARAVQESDAAFGVAWDGDADRTFFWDEEGKFIEGYYTGVLLAENLLRKSMNLPEKVIHCARLGWLFQEVSQRIGGIPLESKTGHGFIKEMMRREQALFAEEMSGHYYFRDNYFADNGMIPFLIVLEMVSTSGKKLSQLVHAYQQVMQISGEINFRVPDVRKVIQKITDYYAETGKQSLLDGLTVEFEAWRFNVRASNTEPLLRLNVEGRSQTLVDQKTAEVTRLIGGQPVKE